MLPSSTQNYYHAGPRAELGGHDDLRSSSPQIPRCQAHPPMDWKPPDFFFFLFWARTNSRVSGSTSEAHSEVGKVGRGLPGPSWEEATERLHCSRYSPTTAAGRGAVPLPVSLTAPPPIQDDASPSRACDFPAKRLSFAWTRSGGQGRGSESGVCR